MTRWNEGEEIKQWIQPWPLRLHWNKTGRTINFSSMRLQYEDEKLSSLAAKVWSSQFRRRCIYPLQTRKHLPSAVDGRPIFVKNDGDCNLRKIHQQVASRTRGNHCSAYLLSFTAFFVFKLGCARVDGRQWHSIASDYSRCL